MSIIWLVERNIHEDTSIHTYLAGNFPVRVISSLPSLNHIVKIEHKLKPDIIVIKDYNSLELYRLTIEQILYKAPHCYIIIIDPNGSLMRKLIDNAHVHWLTIENDLATTLFDLTNNKDALNKQSNQTLRYKDISYDKKNMSLIFHPDEEKEKLPLKEAMLLDFFLENRTQCVTRDQIQKYIWNDINVNVRTIDSHISRLRKKMAHREVRIESIYGGGYVLK